MNTKYGATSIAYFKDKLYVAGTQKNNAYTSHGQEVVVMSLDKDLGYLWGYRVDLSSKSSTYFMSPDVAEPDIYTGEQIYFVNTMRDVDN